MPDGRAAPRRAVPRAPARGGAPVVATRLALVLVVLAGALVGGIGVGAGAVAVSALGSPEPVAAATPTRTYGSEPIDDVLYWANQYAACGLTGNKLAAMMVVPSITESGAGTTPNQAPSPMTLSRWDTNTSLWAFGNKSTPYQKAFWHPGVGMWQFDSAGGWNLIAATAINTWTAAEQAAKTMSSRYCASTAGTDLGKMRYAWGPWFACAASNETTCLGIFNEIFDGTDIWVKRDYGVHRLGGAEDHVCSVAGVGSVWCYRIDPAKAEGNRSFASTSSSIPTPITAPFYSWAAGGREYRTWLAVDSGYDATITASKPINADARTSLTWTTSGPGLCDATAGIGACGNGWTSWSALAPQTASDPAVALNGDGRLEVAYVGADRAVYHAWQSQPKGAVGSSARLGALTNATTVKTTRDAQGALWIFARDTAGAVWSTHQAPDWTAWTKMGTGISVLFDVANNLDGRMELFGLDGGGSVIHQFQWPGGAWSSWEKLGGTGLYSGAAAVNPDGRMELFGVDRSGTLVHSWQTPTSGNGWSGWVAFSGVYIGWPSVRNRSDGLLEVVLRGADYGLWDITQNRTTPTGWSTPTRVPGEQVSGDPVVAKNRDGRMESFAGIIGKGAGHVWQTSPNGPWSGFATLPGADPVTTTAGAYLDGRLFVISRQADTSLLITVQQG